MSLFVRKEVSGERWVVRLAQGFRQACHKRFVEEPQWLLTCTTEVNHSIIPL